MNTTENSTEVATEDFLRQKMREIKAYTDGIQGWIHDNAGAGLYQFARFNAPTPVVVELGSWKGKSTIWLACAIRDRGEGKVYAVDTWKGSLGEAVHEEMLRNYGPDQLYEEFLGNLQKNELLPYVEVIRMDTSKASRRWELEREIGLLFLDAGHSYEEVRRDFELWSPFVAKNGLIVFDDVPSWPGPTRLVSELPNWYVQVATTPNQWVVQKT